MSYLRNNKILLFIIAVLLLTNVALLYFKVWNRDERGKGQGGNKGMLTGVLEKEVGFSKEQLAQYEDIRTKHFESMKPYFDAVRNAKDSLYSLMKLEYVTDSLADAYAERVSERQKQVELKMFRYLKTVEALCTPEQRPKFDSVVKKMVKRPPQGRKGEDKTKK
jgi:periplasmic protein CpxP/Spy